MKSTTEKSISAFVRGYIRLRASQSGTSLLVASARMDLFEESLSTPDPEAADILGEEFDPAEIFRVNEVASRPPPHVLSQLLDYDSEEPDYFPHLTGQCIDQTVLSLDQICAELDVVEARRLQEDTQVRYQGGCYYCCQFGVIML
jgi:hypothetical protein